MPEDIRAKSRCQALKRTELCGAVFNNISAAAGARHLAPDPGHEQLDDPLLLALSQLPALGHPVPLVETAAAASGAGVLSDKDRMPVHGRLPAVAGRLCRGQPLEYEIAGMALDDVHALFINIVELLPAEMERRAELRPAQLVQSLIHRLQALTSLAARSAVRKKQG